MESKTKDQAKKASAIARMERLAANEDFAVWVGDLLEELCAYGQGYSCYDDFAQGKRAAGSFIIASIGKGGEAAKNLMTKLFADHFERVFTNKENN